MGTLRWDEGEFPPLPAWPFVPAMQFPPLSGWRAYFEGRFPADESGTIHVTAPLIDGMSYPLTLVNALQRLRLPVPNPGPLTILVVGASSKAEERLARASNYWDELPRLLRVDCELVFIGPEIAAQHHAHSCHRNVQPHWCITTRNFRGTLGAFLAAEPQHTPEQTIVAGFNGGFGSGLFKLMESWLPDLLELLRRGFLGVFSCANDYSDLRGEHALFTELLHAKLVLQPYANPFKAATVVKEPGEAPVCEWACSSAYAYAVQGRVDGAPVLPALNAAASLRVPLRKLASWHKTTQRPSPVP